MSDDVADRAEAALAELRNHPHRPFGAAGNSYLAAAWRALELVPELVAELKTTRVQLAAVRELHKPRWLNCINYCCSGEECRNRYRGCICDEEWPCSTARQVYSADELGAAEAVTDA